MSCPDDILEEFIGLYESQAVADVESFVARFPSEQRDAIERRCRDYLRTRAELVLTPSTSRMPRRIGRYAIVGVLGVGGMGTVYEGRDDDGRHVAIKALHPHLGISQVQRKRLRLEHLIGSGLRHPHLVEIAESGESDGCVFLVMHQVMRSSLAAEIEAHRLRDEPIDERRVLEVGIAIADALVCLHRNQVIHRDVKPHNILLDERGVPRLSDYGLARLHDDLHSRLTNSGQAIGTLSYMSPEQAIAMPAGVDHRTDIYSLGVVMFEMLTQRVPFRGDDARELQRRIATGDVPPPSRFRTDLDGEFETVLLKTLANAPRDRYADAQELLDDLRRVASARKVMARRIGPLGRLWRKARGRPNLVTSFAAVIIAVWLGASMISADSRRCDVAITTPSVGATVHVRTLDPLSGQYGPARELGTTPLRASLPHGAVRFVVRARGGAFAELSRRLSGDSVAIDARPVAIADVSEGMVEIAADDPPRIPNGPYAVGETREVAAFLIDAREVSNGEYEAFLLATGRPLPDWWPAARDARWASLPVCCVNLDEAIEYAEWAGKRLPTRREWQLAACGPDSRRVPWDGDVGDVDARANVNRVAGHEALQRSRDVWIPLYLEHARPVASTPEDRTATGIYDLLGNVREWSDSIGLDADANGPVIEFASACLHGSSFVGPADPLRSTLPWRAHTPMGRADVGFRCAKSLSP